MSNFLQILPTLLLVSLALVMFGLGLSLTVPDFRRLAKHQIGRASCRERV